MAWYIYIVQCKDDTLYVGTTTDVQARIREHNVGKGCRYTKYRHPVRLLYTEEQPSRQQALRRELEIKGWSRKKKLSLVRRTPAVT